MKVRRFCVNEKKSRKYTTKSLRVKNLAPFFQNNETRDASKRKIARYRREERWQQIAATFQDLHKS